MGFSESKSGQVEIIVIGDEVISGFIVDTNSKYLGQEISELGMGVLCITKIGDDSSVIKERKNFADNGFVEITIVISSKGNLQNKPLVTFRGLPVYEKEDFKYIYGN